MDLVKHYDKLYEESIEKIKQDAYCIDKFIDSTDDARYGITLVIRPDENLKNEIQKFLNKLKIIEPNQYFYPASDIHVTVMSIISCYDGFDLSQISIAEYIKIIEKSIQGCSGFDIEFRGLTTSPSCVMVQGFLSSETLDKIRDNLRKNFKSSNLQQSLDKRYSIQSAHSTVVRLREKLKNRDEYLDFIKQHRNFYFGKFPVDTVELVFNDWYLRKKYVKRICLFKLQS